MGVFISRRTSAALLVYERPEMKDARESAQSAYRVKIRSHVIREEYIVLASTFDDAAAKAIAADRRPNDSHGTHPGHAVSVELYGSADCVVF